MREEHTAPLASVWCWYKVGSRDERAGLTGVSHWVEHMNFKGTENIPRDQVKGIIEQFGGSWNGYTWIDQTTYLETATRDALDRMLFIEAERMARCLYHPDDCESERTVIIAELQGGENDPDVLLDQEVTATALKAHPYRHRTIGWLPDLQTMTRDDLFGHYRRFYIPNNATLVIVGDVDPDAALRCAEKHFGAIAAGLAPTRHWTAEPEQTGERRVTIRREGTTVVLEGRVSRAGRHRPRLLPRAGARHGLDRRKRREPVVELPGHAAAAAGPVVSRAGRAWVGLERRRPDCPDRRAIPLYRLSDRDRWHATWRGRSRVAEGARRGPRQRHHAAGAGARKEAAARAIRVRHRQHHEHRTPARYFETIAGVQLFGSIGDRVQAVSLEAVADAGRAMLVPANRTIGWFEPAGEEPAAPQPGER